MEDKGRGRGWAGRPQVWVAISAGITCLFGLFASLGSFVRAPTPTSIPVIHEYKVLAEATPHHPPANCTIQPCLALTFDDGPDGEFTPRILDILDQHNVPATFFVTGQHAALYPGLIRREHAAGHEIGNHSWDHADFTMLGPEQIQRQIADTQRAVAAAGVPAPTLFRPPYGAVNETVIANSPLTIMRWNIDPEDWKAESAQDVIDHTYQSAHPGGVIILHDTEQYTAEALEHILNGLQGKYQLVTVGELLNLQPGQRGQYFGRR